MKELRSYIRKVLKEAHFEPTELRRITRDNAKNIKVYKDIGNWISADISKSYRAIYQPRHGTLKGYVYRMATLGCAGSYSDTQKMSFNYLQYLDSNGDKYTIPWDFDDVKNAVRFVYLQSQLPVENEHPLNEDISNVKTNDILNIPGMKGWWAMRRKIGIGKNRTYHWEIYKGKEPVGWINDKGAFSMHYNNKDGSMTEKSDRPNFINNPIKVAQYIWLKTQKPNV